MTLFILLALVVVLSVSCLVLGKLWKKRSRNIRIKEATRETVLLIKELPTVYDYLGRQLGVFRVKGETTDAYVTRLANELEKRVEDRHKSYRVLNNDTPKRFV